MDGGSESGRGLSRGFWVRRRRDATRVGEDGEGLWVCCDAKEDDEVDGLGFKHE